MLQKIKEVALKVWDVIDDSNTFIRWALLGGAVYIMLHFGGFMEAEIRITYLLVYYSLVATLIASFMTYVYGKVNYHKAQNDPTLVRAQSEIFYSVYLLCGLIILGTYIAQFN